MKKTLLLLMLTCSCAIATAQERSPLRQTEFISADSLEDEHELLERVRNMPNLEVGKGITFRPKSNWFSLTMRFRMQNMVGLSFDKDFTLTKTDAQVKRLRLRFDGYIYSPKLVYSVQLGFTSYDTEPLPNGNMNIVRDAIVYYVPSCFIDLIYCDLCGIHNCGTINCCCTCCRSDTTDLKYASICCAAC